MSDSPSARSVSVDNPITDPRDDLLGRRDAAKSFAQRVLRLDASEGAVVGVFGPWGSGKTSFLHLVRHELAGGSVHILEFNPWLFSGTEQLVERFFSELSSQIKALKLKDRNIGRGIKEIGDAIGGTAGPVGKLVVVLVGLLAGTAGYPAGRLFGPDGLGIAALVGPLVGGAIGVAATTLKIVGTSIRRRDGGIDESRTKAEKALRQYEKRIIVILDDVDRLILAEILEVFKLVRLVARFPNVIYVIACDRDQVTSVLDHQGGARYLEKIIQIPFNLPEVSRNKLEERAAAEIEAVLEGRNLYDGLFFNILRSVVLPLIRNMRDVRRYTAAVRETVSALAGKVALADLLGLEAIRVFLPPTFDSLVSAVDDLTYPSATEVNVEHRGVEVLLSDRRSKDFIEDYIDVSDEHKELVRDLCANLGLRTNMEATQSPRYVDAERYRSEKRVALGSIMRLYLERIEGKELVARRDAEHLLKLLHDPDSIRTFLCKHDQDRLPYVLAHLGSFPTDRFDRQHVETGVVELINWLSDLPEGLEEYYVRGNVFKIAHKLLLRLDVDVKENSVIIRNILSKLASLSDRSTLIGIVTTDPSVQRVVSAATATELVRNLRQKIRSTSIDRLARGRDLSQVFRVAREGMDGDERFEIPDSPVITFSLLSEFGRVSEHMERLYDDKAVLRVRIRELLERRTEVTTWIDKQGMDAPNADDLFERANAWLEGIDRTEAD